MLHAYKLYTGHDNASHVTEGTVAENDRTDVVAVHFKETPPHSSFDWHEAPEPQYVITHSRNLESTTRAKKTVELQPSTVQISTEDHRRREQMRLITRRTRRPTDVRNKNTP